MARSRRQCQHLTPCHSHIDGPLQEAIPTSHSVSQSHRWHAPGGNANISLSVTVTSMARSRRQSQRLTQCHNHIDDTLQEAMPISHSVSQSHRWHAPRGNANISLSVTVTSMARSRRQSQHLTQCHSHTDGMLQEAIPTSHLVSQSHRWNVPGGNPNISLGVTVTPMECSRRQSQHLTWCHSQTDGTLQEAIPTSHAVSQSHRWHAPGGNANISLSVTVTSMARSRRQSQHLTQCHSHTDGTLQEATPTSHSVSQSHRWHTPEGNPNISLSVIVTLMACSRRQSQHLTWCHSHTDGMFQEAIPTSHLVSQSHRWNVPGGNPNISLSVTVTPMACSRRQS